MNNSNPLVSVVIPCYNHENFVQDSIQSVIDQTYDNIELIVIDDGSSDNSVSKIREMITVCEQRFIRFEFRNRANVGLSATLNEALEWCTGEFYSLIASDDTMIKEKTNIQVNFLKNNKNFVAVFGGMNLINEKNKILESRVGIFRLYDFEEILLHKHDIPAPTQMIRLETIKKVGGYNPEIFIEDWYMWLKISKIGKLCVLPIVLSNYRSHNNNSSKNTLKINDGRIKVLREFQKEESYTNAINNVYWINTYDLLKFNRYLGLKSFLLLFFNAPTFTVKKVIAKFNKNLKYRNNI